MAFEERGKQLFADGVQFERGARCETDLPKLRLPEIAFAGRSNVGKSSLINALTGQVIARASNTPGRTQELNFFKVGTRFFLVDLPGYGFASAPRATVQAWTQLIHAYLRGRQQLKRVFLLIDARHGLKKVDKDIMVMLDRAAVTYQIILTKADKVKESELNQVLANTMDEGKKHVACYPEMLVTSSENGLNIAALRGEIYKIVEEL
ncbi:MAG: YihA family ribosome biogenesis GTP-binding protein [Alphaproteobacteria bacterium]|nr:YihA family ribosome biogenesis GTP-binding protein [Alphaproteobacteria bacterium]